MKGLRESNLARHKIEVADICSFSWILATIVPDKECEERLMATSYLDSRICVAVYIEQDSGRIHVISLRKATREEIRKYAET